MRQPIFDTHPWVGPASQTYIDQHEGHERPGGATASQEAQNNGNLRSKSGKNLNNTHTHNMPGRSRTTSACRSNYTTFGSEDRVGINTDVDGGMRGGATKREGKSKKAHVVDTEIERDRDATRDAFSRLVARTCGGFV
jgi:hypothetical protein